MDPTVTVAVPLHGSARWVDNVAANVRSLPPMVTEIIISDQTCIDDAAEQLRILLRGEPRVVIRAAAADLGFSEHFQQLLEAGSGELFMWMPHDDIFDPSWVPMLAETLGAHPRAWLAFGQVRLVDFDGTTPYKAPNPRSFPFPPGEISGRDCVRMMLGDWAWVAFRGLFRRRNVLAAGLRMEPDNVVTHVDSEWVFAVALRSALVYDDRAITWKRMYSGSTHTLPSWRLPGGTSDQAAWVGLRRHGPSGMPGFLMRSHVQLTRLAVRSQTRVAPFVPARLKSCTRPAVARIMRAIREL